MADLVLVTGSAGHLGEAVVRTLRAAGRAVRGVDRRASPYTDVVGSIGDAGALARDAAAVLDRRVPGWRDAYRALGWRMLPVLDRVYDNARARRELGCQPRHDFAAVVSRAPHGDILSALARDVGIKGYHDGVLLGGMYPT